MGEGWSPRDFVDPHQRHRPERAGDDTADRSTSRYPGMVGAYVSLADGAHVRGRVDTAGAKVAGGVDAGDARSRFDRSRFRREDDVAHAVRIEKGAGGAIVLEKEEALAGNGIDRTAMRDIAADPRHLGAEIGAVAVLRTWGQTLQHHPHLHCIVPGGGLSPDQTRWVACRPGFFLPVRVLSRRFRTLLLARLQAAFVAGEGTSPAHSRPWPRRVPLPNVSMRCVRSNGWSMPSVRSPDPIRCWPISAAIPIASPWQTRRLTRLADGQVDFTWKDYRHHGKTKVMTLAADEFIRRFLLHAVPDGFHRIRHVGFLANGHRTAKLALCRALLAAPAPDPPPPENYRERTRRLTGHALDVCPHCGGTMLERGPLPRRPQPQAPFWCDSS